MFTLLIQRPIATSYGNCNLTCVSANKNGICSILWSQVRTSTFGLFLGTWLSGQVFVRNATNWQWSRHLYQVTQLLLRGKRQISSFSGHTQDKQLRLILPGFRKGKQLCVMSVDILHVSTITCLQTYPFPWHTVLCPLRHCILFHKPLRQNIKPSSYQSNTS